MTQGNEDETLELVLPPEEKWVDAALRVMSNKPIAEGQQLVLRYYGPRVLDAAMRRVKGEL